MRMMISPSSAVNLSTSIRDRCRGYVKDCEACRLSRPKPSTRRAPLPLRFNVSGQPIELSKEEQMRVEEQTRTQIKRLDQGRHRQVAVVRRPFEQLHLDIVVYWQFGEAKRWLITCIDNSSPFMDARYSSHCPTSSECAEFLLDYVRQAGVTPSRVVCDNGLLARNSPE